MESWFNETMTALYIHIPFCEKKCFYCSFVVSIGQEHKIDLYLDCLAREAQVYQRTEIQSVYIGGGTPSLLSIDQFRKLTGIINQNFALAKNIEWTLEANPESVDKMKAELWKKSGVNRMSLGVQSFNSKFLRYLGRNHDQNSADRAYHILRDEEFDNINLDLMYSFPDQTTEELSRDVLAIAEFASEHLSLYALTIEENSRFYIKKVELSDQDRQKDDYALVVDLLEKNGFQQYEISNFSRAGRESRHNINYWQSGDYIGLGVGAHSHIQGRRYWNVSKLSEYLGRVAGGQKAEEGEEILTPEKRLAEALVFGLRMNAGIDIQNLERRLNSVLDHERKLLLEELIQQRFCQRDRTHLRVTSKGRLVLDEISARLI